MTTPISSSDVGASADKTVVSVTSSDTASLVDGTHFQIIHNDSGVFTESASGELLYFLESLVSPPSGSTVGSTTPAFGVFVKRVSIASDFTVVIQLQLSTAADFSVSPVYMQFSTSALDGQAVTTVLTATPLSVSTTYYWRVRHVLSGVPGPWTSPFHFTVGSGAGDTVSGGWTSSSFGVQPQIWFATPSRAKAGDSIRAYGMGLGDTQGSSAVLLAGSSAAVSAWGTVAPLSDAYTSNRQIDTVSQYVSPQHQEIVCVVPSVATPGGPLLVSRDAPPSGPMLWYRAEDTTGPSVSTWTAHAGAGPTLGLGGFGSTSPALGAPTLNGFSGLTFADKILFGDFNGTGTDGFNFHFGLHLFAVVRFNSLSSDGSVFQALALSSSEFTDFGYDFTASTLRMRAHGVTSSVFTSDKIANTPPVVNTPYVLEWSYSPTALRVGGSTDSVTSGPGDSGSPGGFSVGEIIFGGNVILYEIIVYGYQLSGASLTTQRSDLATKYGISA